MIATLLYACTNEIGEAATWLEASQQFAWVDIEGCMLYIYSSETKIFSKHLLPARVSTIIPSTEENIIILSLQGSLVNFNLQTGKLITMTEIESNQPNFRPNDGKVSPEGRLWLGIMHMTNHHETGSLCCIEPNLTIRKVLVKQSIPNGIVWDKAGTKMYYADSGRGCIEEYHYDPKNGNIQFIRVAIRVPLKYGSPDGMTIDNDGNLWIAHWGGFGVYIWNPKTGELVDKIDVPVPNVTSCTFGGREKNQLFITTARAGLSPEDLLAFPLSGSLFVAEVTAKAGENHYPFITTV